MNKDARIYKEVFYVGSVDYYGLVDGIFECLHSVRRDMKKVNKEKHFPTSRLDDTVNPFSYKYYPQLTTFDLFKVRTFAR